VCVCVCERERERENGSREEASRECHASRISSARHRRTVRRALNSRARGSLVITRYCIRARELILVYVHVVVVFVVIIFAVAAVARLSNSHNESSWNVLGLYLTLRGLFRPVSKRFSHRRMFPPLAAVFFPIRITPVTHHALSRPDFHIPFPPSPPPPPRSSNLCPFQLHYAHCNLCINDV